MLLGLMPIKPPPHLTRQVLVTYKVQNNVNCPVSQAGYDAYLAGFCFVRTCHMAATISYLDIKRMRVLEFPELLSVVAEHENHVNLARAAAHHVNLGGEEPAGTRPPHLHVSSRGGGRPLDTALLANTFSR